MKHAIALIGLCILLQCPLLHARQIGRHGGGDGSGYVRIGISYAPPAVASRFTGGNGSGYSRSGYFFTPPVAPVTAMRYGGGVGSGYALMSTQFVPPTILPKFGGGIADGYARQSYSFSSNPLPVVLVYFEARLVSTSVFLTWKTASEYQNDYFQIEKSHDGINFWPIGRVIGHGTTTEPKKYDFEDLDLSSGQAYYRLKQVDFDGGFEYSNLVFISNVMHQVLRLFPNPANVGETINLVCQQTDGLQIALIDLNGRWVNVSQIATSNNTMQLMLPSATAPGIYVLHLQAEGSTQFIKVQIK